MTSDLQRRRRAAAIFTEPNRSVTLGDRCAIAAHAFLHEPSRSLTTSVSTSTPVSTDQPTTSRGIRLGEDVWVGAGAGITDGVHIGNHAVIGMGSVVTRDVVDYAIVAGSPAKVVGDRRERRAPRRRTA